MALVAGAPKVKACCVERENWVMAALLREARGAHTLTAVLLAVKTVRPRNAWLTVRAMIGILSVDTLLAKEVLTRENEEEDLRTVAVTDLANCNIDIPWQRQLSRIQMSRRTEWTST